MRKWMNEHDTFAGIFIWTPVLFALMIGGLVLLTYADDSYHNQSPQITCVTTAHGSDVCGTTPYRP